MKSPCFFQVGSGLDEVGWSSIAAKVQEYVAGEETTIFQRNSS